MLDLTPDEWRTIGAVVGALAGVSAFLWNVWRAWRDRRPRLRLFTREIEEHEKFSLGVTVTNIGQTQETVLEIGLESAVSPGKPLDDRRVKRGTSAGIEWVLKDIARAIRDSADTRSPFGQMFEYRPSLSAWSMHPGAVADAEFDLTLYEEAEPKMGSSGFDLLPGGPILPTYRAYAVLASGRRLTGKTETPNVEGIERVRRERAKRRADYRPPTSDTNEA